MKRARKAAEENKAINGALKNFSALRLQAVPPGVGCPTPRSSTLFQLMSSSELLPEAKSTTATRCSCKGISPWAPTHSFPGPGKYLLLCCLMELLEPLKAELLSFHHQQHLLSLICLLTSHVAGSHFSPELCWCPLCKPSMYNTWPCQLPSSLGCHLLCFKSL